MKLFEISKKEVRDGTRVWRGDDEWWEHYHHHAFGGDRGWPKEISKSDIKLIQDYVINDKPPIGKTGVALERLIALSEPTLKNMTSYRGIVFPRTKLNEIISLLEQKREFVFRNSSPSSFSISQGTAWDFSKKKGHRKRLHNDNTVPVILEVLIPAGTKVARLNIAFGIGWEHVVSKTQSIVIKRYRKYYDGYILTGVLS